MQKHPPSFAGQFLKSYREKYHLTQEELAADLHIEPRTLRAYENGERQLNNINDLRRMADLLGIEPEQLGVATALSFPRTPEQIEEAIQHAWELVNQSRLYEARVMIEQLAKNVYTQIATEDSKLLQSLANVYHAAGYIVSEATQARDALYAALYYQQMEMIGRILKNDTVLNIALTYQGDMHRRLGNLDRATTCLEAARDTTPQADKAARGNGIQLLARVYIRRGEFGNFERAMRECEELAHNFNPLESSTRGQYSLGTVYEEYGRSYADLGQVQNALEYFDKAEVILPKTRFWELLMVTSRAMALIKGNELQSGVQLAIEAAEQCRQAGILRYLDRIQTINQYLEKLERQIGSLRKPLQDALYGGEVLDI